MSAEEFLQFLFVFLWKRSKYNFLIAIVKILPVTLLRKPAMNTHWRKSIDQWERGKSRIKNLMRLSEQTLEWVFSKKQVVTLYLFFSLKIQTKNLKQFCACSRQYCFNFICLQKIFYLVTGEFGLLLNSNSFLMLQVWKAFLATDMCVTFRSGFSCLQAMDNETTWTLKVSRTGKNM